MRTDILEYLQKEAYERCKRSTNIFGMGCYYHIEAVVKNARILAERYNADEEIVLIASWLHDIASVTDYSLYEAHHIHGAVMARNILIKLSYEESRIQRVENCIKKHRGSIYFNKDSLEELCVAEADAISHLDSIPSLLYLAYVEHKMNIVEGTEFVRGKLERSFHKLSPESQVFYRDKYQQVMDMLK